MIALPVLVVTAAAAVMPHAAGVVPLFTGRATINFAPAEYEVVPGGASDAALDRAAVASGWHPAPASAMTVPTRAGALALRAYTDGSAMLLQGAIGGASPVTVRARLDRIPVWTDATGEAPGREPAGSPRPVAGRRLLHVAGEGFEAACYRSSAPPAAILRDAARRLGWRSWNVAPLGETGLLAAKPGSPDLAWHVRPDGAGSLVLVLASERDG